MPDPNQGHGTSCSEPGLDRALNFTAGHSSQSTEKAAILPAGLVHPEILEKSRVAFMHCDHDVSVFGAFKAIEVAVRTACGFSDGELGVPLSAASTASFLTAVIRTFIEIGPSPRASSATRQAVTVAFVNPAGRASSMNQAMNSSSPRLYTRRVIGDETLSSTSAFNLCQCVARSGYYKFVHR